ncbi:hypothetical protein QWY82_09455 [Simiduia curdlanivorans]|uniref:Uncharacterized protein n=1 Tax=Simiduia curdlanivorans TaxID=1492769 RepID=A0ABV8V6Z0_9GAMM|nr:hypothetical protein [Simiduia curdlanivorans]MDN3639032.1 hypothetical protein [Simiduia curdlanivorans]
MNTIWQYGGYRYLKLSALGLLLALFGYLLYYPVGPRNGDTLMGYLLGCVAAGLVLVLLGLGAKRRWWISWLGSQQAWLAVHFYLGFSLLPLTLLHTGFQIGNGLHLALFILLVADVASGCYGIYAYSSHPQKLRALSEGGGYGKLRQALQHLDQRLIELAKSTDPSIYRTTLSALQRTALPTNLRQALFSSDNSTLLLPDGSSYSLRVNPDQQALLNWLRHQQAEDSSPRTDQILALCQTRQELLRRSRKALIVESLLGHWLQLHLLLSLAFMCLLLVHIAVVLMY